MPNGSPLQKGIYNGNYKHGGKGEKLYGVWCSIRQRCLNRKSRAYKWYGGRGINICSEWSDYSMFRKWAYEHGYREGLSIDRINNDGNYSPENCRWATRKMQANNQQNTLRLSINGEIKTLNQLADEIGINPDTLYYRIYRRVWNLERAIREKVSLNRYCR